MYICIIYEKAKGQIPLGPLLGKQNIQAKEVYSNVFKRFGACGSEKRIKSVGWTLIDLCVFDDNENALFAEWTGPKNFSFNSYLALYNKLANFIPKYSWGSCFIFTGLPLGM